MFKFKHEIELVTSEKIFLFGEDYYNDKRFFWDMHRFKLIELCEKVQHSGFPVLVKDLQSRDILKLETDLDFKNWLKENQPYTNIE